MRLIQATVPPSARGDVEDLLSNRDISYFATEETGTEDYSEVLYVSLPEEEVEGVLKALYDAGLDADDHVVLIDTEVDIFGRAESSPKGGGGGHARIASAELEGKTKDLIPDVRTFVTMMVLSTVVATTGLVLNSAAVVVGSMVLAPLFGPAASASVGTVIDRPGLFWRGVRYQVLGVVVAVAGATVFAWLVKTTYLLPGGFVVSSAPQVVQRLSPDLLSLVVAFVAGVAGIISIATAAGRALVGVMMAAALLPPAAVVGIGIAWGELAIAAHSAILLSVNLLAINFAGLVTLWYLGYRPQSWLQVPDTRRAMLKRGGVLLVAILVASAFLWNVTYANAQRSEVESSIEAELSDLLESEEYESVTLLDVTVVQNRDRVFGGTEKVVVTLGRPPGTNHPNLHGEIYAVVEEQVGSDVNVDIRVTLVVSGDPAEGVSAAEGQTNETTAGGRNGTTSQQTNETTTAEA